MKPPRRERRSVILTCAITGSIHVPSQSPYLPITPAQIAQQAIDAAREGASIIHLHARAPTDGRPTGDPAVYMQFLPPIHDGTDAIINITTGGAPGMTLDERLAAARLVSPEMTSLNMGTINNGFFASADKIRDWRHDWERPFLEGTYDGIFKNTFKDIEHIMRALHQDLGVMFEFECYDVGQLYNLAYLLDKGLYRGPLFIQLIVGILGGIGAGLDNLLHMLRTAERLFGHEFEWSVLAAGRHQLPMGVHNALLGGNARVGLEDSLTVGGSRELATSNAVQVSQIRAVLESLGLTIATPREARERLGLKGRSQTRLDKLGR